MLIIFRYLSREIFYTMIAVTIIVVFVFLCNQFVRYLDYVATGKYAANMLFQLLSLEVPLLFSLLLPLGLFLGVLLAYGRLYADSEMTVLMACGLSQKQLIKITMSFAGIVCIAVSLLVFWIQPVVALHRDQLMDVAESTSIFDTILPGHFQASQGGRRVFYIEKVSRGHEHAHRVFVAEQLKQKSTDAKTAIKPWVVLSAKGGYQQVDKKTGDHFVVAKEGYRYQGVPGQKNYQIVKYDTYGVRTNSKIDEGRNEGVEILSTPELFKTATKNHDNMAELQWRFSIPISVLVLALLAIPLSKVHPRRGRFAQLIPAVLIYIVYANMLFVCRNWLEEGRIPSWLGMWWIHLVILALGVWLLSRSIHAKSISFKRAI